MPQKVRTAVFPVAGLGTRFLPATKIMPKEMLTVVDKPLIQYAIEEARAAGIERFILVNGRNKHALEDHFDFNFELNAILSERNKTEALAQANEMVMPPGFISSVRQQEPLGLGHAVWCAKSLVGDEPFAVVLPDDLVLSEKPCLQQLIEVYEETAGNVVAVMDVPREHTARYGILDVENDDGRIAAVKGLVEKPAPEEAPSTLSIIGRYVLLPRVMDFLDDKVVGAGGEIQLTDAMARLIGETPFHGMRFEGTRFDCGDKVGYLQANVAFALARNDMQDAARAALAPYL
ncbi:MAG TPA: UTP--glucose-1-phosphate uridylyltransferase GalU [Alphaproteobacteria bacterium]|nr:UTP--glucose-1-phosphate uridylyltransferase GalU [Alphaproteobacteria bacterium]